MISGPTKARWILGLDHERQERRTCVSFRGISSSRENWFIILDYAILGCVVAKSACLRWMTNTSGRASMSTVICWLDLLRPDDGADLHDLRL